LQGVLLYEKVFVSVGGIAAGADGGALEWQCAI
jgi:hypothetical protein